MTVLLEEGEVPLWKAFQSTEYSRLAGGKQIIWSFYMKKLLLALCAVIPAFAFASVASAEPKDPAIPDGSRPWVETIAEKCPFQPPIRLENNCAP